MEDEDDAVERDGAAVLLQVPEPREVVVGRVALDLRRRRVADRGELFGEGRALSRPRRTARRPSLPSSNT